LSVSRSAAGFHCVAKSMTDGSMAEWSARVVIAAHGSWGRGPLDDGREESHPDDLLGFKAHFENTALDPELMPLLAFPGGYGGMAHCENGRVSLSCCVRRERLAKLRTAYSGDAGEAVLCHILQNCQGARAALAGARRTLRFCTFCKAAKAHAPPCVAPNLTSRGFRPVPSNRESAVHLPMGFFS